MVDPSFIPEEGLLPVKAQPKNKRAFTQTSHENDTDNQVGDLHTQMQEEPLLIAQSANRVPIKRHRPAGVSTPAMEI